MAKVMDHVTYDLGVYMSQQQDEATETPLDCTGWPMQYGERYWKVDGNYVPTGNEDLLHDFLVSEGEDYGQPITYDYEQLENLLTDFHEVEEITWIPQN